jgi:hypothetical protein
MELPSGIDEMRYADCRICWLGDMPIIRYSGERIYSILEKIYTEKKAREA